jgi:polyisoprenoid-binding protein YceI
MSRPAALHTAPRAVTRSLLAALAAATMLVAPSDPGATGSRAWTRGAYGQVLPGALRYSVVTEKSEARYRVREQLVGLDFPNDAVGVTNAITGEIVLDDQGRVRPGDSKVTVDLRELKSDRDRRDNYVRRNTLETDRYPTVVFAPVEVRGLRLPLPASGTATWALVGDLTVRDRTQRVTWDATATFDGPEVGLKAKTAFRFEDFGLRVPRVSVVLSVADDIRLEVDLLLRRS